MYRHSTPLGIVDSVPGSSIGGGGGALVVEGVFAERGKLTAWLKSWDAAAEALRPRDVLFYTHLKDEPNHEAACRYVQK